MESGQTIGNLNEADCRPFNDKPSPLKVAVLAFDGVRPFQLSVPCEIFGEAHTAGDRAKLRVCSIEDGPIRSSAGFQIETDFGLDEFARADVIFVPSWKLPHERPAPKLLEALLAANANGAIIAGLCLGAFVLAETGLLDGQRATTHWAFADDFRRRFPLVDLDETQLYVDGGKLVTSAGVAAGVDCCLHLASRLFGAEYANGIARTIVAAPHRASTQSQLIDRPMPESNRDSRFRTALFEIVRTISDRHTIDSVAASLGMSRRNFTRMFQQTLGISFHEWLADMRLAIAVRALEATSKSVEQIAIETGFGSAVTFRARFATRYGVSPSVWRRAFRQKNASPLP